MFRATPFNFFLLILVSKWSQIQSTFVEFQRISGSRCTSNFGTIWVKDESQCVYSCIVSPNCSYVGFDWINKTCELGSTWMYVEQISDSQNWNIFYKKDHPVCSARSCFQMNKAETTWDEANTFCQAKYSSGHLAYIKTESQKQVLRLLMSDNELFSAWIGGSDTATEGVFLWTDSTPVFVVGGYVTWHTSQPDNHNNEDCLMAYGSDRDHTLNDLSCGKLLRSVCQYPLPT